MTNRSKHPQLPRPVLETSHISFDEGDKTFRLYAGNSIYAFCINPELTLEHLHWGPKLPPGYDLRFLSQSTRSTHFSTVEAAPDGFSTTHPLGGKIVLAAETLEEITKTWRENKVWVPTEMSEKERFQRRRLENFSWRIMSKIAQENHAIQFDRMKARQENADAVTKNPEVADLFGLPCCNTQPPQQPRTPNKAPSKLSRWKREFPSSISIPNMVTSYSTDCLSTYDNQMGPLPPSPGKHAITKRRIQRSKSFVENRVDDDHDHTSTSVPLKFCRSKNVLKYVPSEGDLTALKLASTKNDQIIGGTDKTPKHRILQSMDDALLSKFKPSLPRRANTHTFERTAGKLGKGILCVEYADLGTGDFRTPSFSVVDNFTGSSISPLRYRKHRIYRGKLPMPDGMPSIRVINEHEASTLVVTLVDSATGLEVDLVYVAMHNYDVITRRTVFRNNDNRNICSTVMVSGNGKNYQCGSSKVILKASSMTVDFEAEPLPFHLVKLSGSWGRERYVDQSKLTHGIQSFGSTRGISSHEHNPFAAITFGYPSETSGEVRAFTMVYSGNFLIEAEQGELGRLRINVGIHPLGFQWELQQGESFASPEVVLARSSQGLGGMSRTLHRLFLDRLIPHSWADEHPPVMLNTWEAKHFHVNHQNVVSMAVKGHKIGINLIVLDDGWFINRSNPHQSLGEWMVDMEKFPSGLKGLVRAVNDAGCKFGLWFEPEMICTNSTVFHGHPDWYLHVPGRCSDRHQYILDLTRTDVRQYVYQSMARVLKSANIEYVKWNISGPLLEAYSISAHQQEVWQTEISHRYILGVYALQTRLREEFPHILLENSSAGGGRFDAGMLYFSPQIWCSDNTDPLVRLKIQYGTSFVYPARCVGTMVSSVPHSLTGTMTRLRTRAMSALSGTFGFCIDLQSARPKDLLYFQKQIELFKRYHHIIYTGDLYRLWDPFQVNFAAWMYVTRDKKEAVVLGFSVNSDHWSSLVPRLPLQGLDPEADYAMTEPYPNNITQSEGGFMMIETEVPIYQLSCNAVVLAGSILMTAGLPIKFYSLDDSVMFHLQQVNVQDDASLSAPEEESHTTAEELTPLEQPPQFVLQVPSPIQHVVMGVDDFDWL